MKYGKFEDGALTLSPHSLYVDGVLVTNPSSKTLEAAGYLPVIETFPENREGLFPVGRYELQDGKIVKTWTYSDKANKPVVKPSETELLRAQVKALSDRNDFMEDCIAEMAMLVYS